MAQRWSATKRSHVYITQAHVVNAYNKYMGGMDLLDRFLSEYRPRLRSKKWWWCLFANFLNMSVLTGWRIHKVVGGTLSHLEFRSCEPYYEKFLTKQRDQGQVGWRWITSVFQALYMFVFLLANKADASSAKVTPEASVSSAMCCFTMAALKPFMQTLTENFFM